MSNKQEATTVGDTPRKPGGLRRDTKSLRAKGDRILDLIDCIEPIAKEIIRTLDRANKQVQQFDRAATGDKAINLRADRCSFKLLLSVIENTARRLSETTDEAI